MENLGAFAVACVVFVVVPGPSVLFVVGRSISLGRRGGLLSVAGNTLGTVPAIIAVSFGLGAIISASAVAFTVMKIAGAAYLVWLGVQAIRHRRDSSDQGSMSSVSSATLLRQGFVVGLTNPKALAFFVAVLPQFVAPSAGPVWAQLLLLGLMLQMIGLLCDTVWALLAGAARSWFARSPRRLSAMSVSGGVMMIGLGGALAVSGARD
ncbi:LysE family translocator [Microbacterium cremeum]|uniref:LysE family translocator n=1 Tax=Microbacterium cremeum TaxID=2782169 RepID=UPI001E5FC7FA|nr:LysE family translocator [Microbacterium cremeum]